MLLNLDKYSVFIFMYLVHCGNADYMLIMSFSAQQDLKLLHLHCMDHLTTHILLLKQTISKKVYSNKITASSTMLTKREKKGHFMQYHERRLSRKTTDVRGPSPAAKVSFMSQQSHYYSFRWYTESSFVYCRSGLHNSQWDI